MANKSEMPDSHTEVSDSHDAEKHSVLQYEVKAFETEADALPPGYFKSMYFIGTMFAAQSAWAAVSAIR
jgi:hypothetical protein